MYELFTESVKKILVVETWCKQTNYEDLNFHLLNILW